MVEQERRMARALVIRTGCLSCRARGVPCDSNNPDCKTYQSANWASNLPPKLKGRPSKYIRGPLSIKSISVGWEGTQREQQCLYFFSTISAPELAGYLDFAFWSEVLLQATHDDPAIKHAVAAIGASHEYKLRRQAAKFNLETDGLHAFALRQINKAIKALVQPSQGTSRGLLRALTASILFACFESLNDSRAAAVPHVVHATRILKQFKQTAEEDGQKNHTSAYPIPMALIEPLVVQYESQLGVYYGDTKRGKEEYLDITQPFTISSVPSARILLLQGISVTQDAFTQYGDDRTSLKTAKADLAAWFRKWGAAFDSFLSRTQIDSTMIRSCKLMKCHQLAALVVASVDPTRGEDAWVPFTDDMKKVFAMISDLHSRDPRRTILSSQPPHTPYFSSTMGMTEPLYIIASRCKDEETARKATALLGRLPPSEGANSSWRISFLENLLCTISGTGRNRSIVGG
ncbi:hypothetical protein M409DRAFT_58654 [Zasmidium cellare ATCC 36951]|uniref:Zn(2)-C6 fungal-type domain-containing protein n=1 Tax=Zasmidium cellare ATCC 36951 TaxID=1080233 RepID=A0A6A6C4L7_ZASCE|nr:uncharacterized protein M409DRAFT_58654 [Zasmidium cellare ATCC 36951]KAF2161873.1 hypothetical protein M409DRAFT_58654 [Zasmidium cellare ATCC 36951]